MKKLGIILFVVTLAIIVSSCGDDRPIEPEYELAVFPIPDSLALQPPSIIWEQSAEKHAITLVIVKADWCGYCHQLLEQTLADSTVMGLISNNFNLCIIDGDSRDTLRCEGNLCTYHQYVRDILKVKGYPTSIFFDSAGNEIARAPGYLDASAYAYLLREVYNRM